MLQYWDVCTCVCVHAGLYTAGTAASCGGGGTLYRLSATTHTHTHTHKHTHTGTRRDSLCLRVLAHSTHAHAPELAGTVGERRSERSGTPFRGVAFGTFQNAAGSGVHEGVKWCMLKNGPGNRVGDRPWTTQRGTDAAPPTHTGAAFERGDVYRQHRWSACPTSTPSTLSKLRPRLLARASARSIPT